MRTAFSVVLLSLLAPAVLAAGKPEWAGEPGCKVANTSREAGASVKWTGPCSDGYAHGKGILDISRGKVELVHYEGDMQGGLMHGTGYLQAIGNLQYEGGFQNGAYHGFGIAVSSSGRYDGEWKRGKRDGKGKMAYLLGGQYDGQWKENRFHGAGTARYISGREETTEFVNGVKVGQVAIPKAEPKHAIMVDRAGSHIRRKAVRNGVVPFSQSYDEMSDADRATVRSWYPLMDDGDEPPYPAEGTAAMYKAITTVTGKMRANGLLYLVVDVDEQGKAARASVFATPDREFSEVVMKIVLLQKFKPGVCAGKPCAMKFPVSVRVSTD
jgi:hypothetical protein